MSAGRVGGEEDKQVQRRVDNEQSEIFLTCDFYGSPLYLLLQLHDRRVQRGR